MTEHSFPSPGARVTVWTALLLLLGVAAGPARGADADHLRADTGWSNGLVLGLTAETFAKGFGVWSPPHSQTSSYHGKYMTFPVEGRIFSRGTDGVFCYDLRHPNQ